MTALTSDILKTHVRYDPDRGDFYWLYNSNKPANWNARDAETLAGTVSKSGRRTITIYGKHYLSSRLAWLYMTGEWPSEMVDHKDRDNSNNKWENLREATRSQNCQNASERKSPYGRNVTFEKTTNLWKVRVTANKKAVTRRFETLEEAKQLAIELRKSLHGDFFAQ